MVRFEIKGLREPRGSGSGWETAEQAEDFCRDLATNSLWQSMFMAEGTKIADLKICEFDFQYDFFDYMNESKKSTRKSLSESDDITKLMKAIYKFLKKYGDYYFYEGVIHHYSWELSNNIILGEYDFNGVAINQTVKIYLSENYDGFYIERGYLNKGKINDIKFVDTYTSSIEEMLDDVDYVCNCINYELLSIAPSKHSK